MSEFSALLAVQNAAREARFLLALFRILKYAVSLGESAEWQGDSNQGSWKAFKGTETLKTISWTPVGSPFMNHRGCLDCRSDHRLSQYSILLITHPYTPLPVASFLCKLSIIVRASEHIQ